MKFTLTILLSVIVSSLSAQSLCSVKTPLKFPSNRNQVLHDTVGFKQFPKSNFKAGDRFAAFEYPVQGETTFNHYPVDESNGEVVIQNSFRKGGPYVAPSGKKFGHAIFWTRVVNKTAVPFTLTLQSPADSFALSSSGSYLKLFLPTDTMTLDKTILYAYGATHLMSFFDTHWNEQIMFTQTLQPKEEWLFYVAVVAYQGASGIRQAELVMQDGKLFYRLSGTGTPSLDEALIPAGDLVFRR